MVRPPTRPDYARAHSAHCCQHCAVPPFCPAVKGAPTMTDTLPEAAVAAGFTFYGNADGTPMFPGFEAYMGPFYYRRDGDCHEFMVRVAPHHANMGNAAHGGMLAALT